MVQVSYPGVYIVELPSGVHTIAGVSTSVAAFFGRAKKGPMNQAVHCFSYSDFERAFGGPHPQSDLAWSVRMFFGNGGTECYAVRLASGAVKAAVTLKTLGGLNVLTATAKSDGAWGNAIQLEISYNTPAPDETFNLTAIQYDGDTEVTRETCTSLTMDPDAPRYAPTFVSQSSGLIDLALHAEADAASANDIHLIANSFAGFSQSRPFLTTPIATFRTELEAMFPAAGPALNFQINVDDAQWVNVDLLTLFGAAAPAVVRGSAWALNDVATRVQSLINTALNASVPGLQVAVAWTTIGNFSVLRITSDTAADKRSVRIRRGASNDISTALMVGLDQGGIEPVRYSNYRPAPTAAYFRDVDQILPLASLTRDEITSIAIDGGAPITFDFSTLTPAAGDPWFLSSTGTQDGVREKLGLIAKAINAAPSPAAPAVGWRAEVWGYHLAIIAKSGTVNAIPSAVVSAPNVLLGGANFVGNTRRYVLGTAGASPFQLVPGILGNDGGAPGQADYEGSEATQNGFHALDKMDMFNLMILPRDREIAAAVRDALWGPASAYCAAHRAFLIIDPPDTWTTTAPGQRPAAVVDNTSLIDTLRAPLIKENSAVYYPNVKYRDGALLRTIGPAGMIAGLMARIDSTRGVWKAPAGLEASLISISDLEVKLTDQENGTLNKKAVNALRNFPSGFVCWGARTLAGDDDTPGDWKYVPIRRFALFLEESLFRGTKWVVFEPNDEPLWAQIRNNLNAFMMGLFRQGAFQGTSPDQAFYVKCDSETTTQADRNLGIVNIEVGFSPLKPAEFVVIKIQQIAEQD